MKKIGIECETIEDDMWGLSRIVHKLLEEISKRPELKEKYVFHLYFKSKIPNLPYLDNPIFVKKIVRLPFQWFSSFSLYYYILLPIRLWFEGLDMMFFPNYMLPLLFSGKSLVHLTNDVIYEMNSPAQKLKYRLAYKVFTTWAVRHATHIMTLSEHSRSELIHMLSIIPDRITANHLGIDIGKSEKNRKSRYFGEEYILCLGQAFPRRHAKETMLAFEKIAPKFPKLMLYMVGYDKYKPLVIDELAEEINKKLGREGVIHKDRVTEDEIADLYSSAKLTVYVSSKEAFGLPPLEALALGSVPVVADNSLTHEELGDNAFFVAKLHDVDSLADALAKGLTNEAKRAEIRRNSDGIVRKFTWAAHAERFLKLCDLLTK